MNEIKQIYYKILVYISYTPGLEFDVIFSAQMAEQMYESIRLFINEGSESLGPQYIVPFMGFITFTTEIIYRHDFDDIIDILKMITTLESTDLNDYLSLFLTRIIFYYEVVQGYKNQIIKTDLYNCLSKMLTLINQLLIQSQEHYHDEIQKMIEFVSNGNFKPLNIRLVKIMYMLSLPFENSKEIIEDAFDYLFNSPNINDSSILQNPVFEEMNEFVLKYSSDSNYIEAFLKIIPQDGQFINDFFNKLVVNNTELGIIALLIPHLEIITSVLDDYIEIDKLLGTFAYLINNIDTPDNEVIIFVIEFSKGLLTEYIKQQNFELALYILSDLLLNADKSLEIFNELITYLLSGEFDIINQEPDVLNEFLQFLSVILLRYDEHEELINQCFGIFFSTNYFNFFIENKFFENSQLVYSYIYLVDYFIWIIARKQNYLEIAIQGLNIICECYNELINEDDFIPLICKSVCIYFTVLNSLEQNPTELINNELMLKCATYICENFEDFTKNVFMWSMMILEAASQN